MCTPAPMDALVNITAQVIVNTKQIFNWGKLFDEKTKVQDVVDKTITTYGGPPAARCALQGVCGITIICARK